MSDPWLTIIGLGEDGVEGLGTASRTALEKAEIVMGPPRHLALLPPLDADQVPWPVPFADGIDRLLRHRGRQAVALASGDPFWFGAGSVLARHLEPGEWRALPGPSSFSLAAARLGWPLERVTCLGLHAAPFTRLRPHLAKGARLFVTVRDTEAAQNLAAYLTETGFGSASLTILEALGGPRERITTQRADSLPHIAPQHPLLAAIETGDGPALPRASGRSDDWFDNDGQITKRPIRALTLSALAP